MDHPLFPIALLIFVQIIFAGYAVFGSAAFKSGTSPIVFAFLRNVIASCCFIPSFIIEEYYTSKASHRPMRLLPKQEHTFYFILLGIQGVWGSQLMSALTISNLSAPIYGLLKPMVPIVTYIISVIFGVTPFEIKTRETKYTILGVLLAIIGCIVIVADSSAESKNVQLGSMYVSVYMLCSGSYPITQKAMLSRFDYSPLFLTSWAYMIGTMMICSSLLVAAPLPSAWSVNSSGIAGLFFAGVLTSFFNYYAMAWINKRTSPVLISAGYTLQSFFTPLLSSLFLNADIYPDDYIGGIVIIIGLGFCIRAQLLQNSKTVSSSSSSSSSSSTSTTLLLVEPQDIDKEKTIEYSKPFLEEEERVTTIVKL